MGWWSRKPATPESDPIGEICRLLVEKPWEWVIGTSKPARARGNGHPQLTHVSGVFLIYTTTQEYSRGIYPEVWLGVGDEMAPQVNTYGANRLYAAIMGNAAARIARPKYDMGLTVRALIQAVKSEDLTAARALADAIMEIDGATPKD